MTVQNLLSNDETLFKNMEVFDLDYVPDNFAHRDQEIQTLASYIKPALRGSRPVCAFITGIPATGKTTAVRKLSEEIDNVTICHINCQTYKTSQRVFAEIHKSIFGFVPPDTGIPFATLFDKIFNRLEKEKKVLLVVLDEVNELEDKNDVLYNILRANETFEVKTGVWAIACDNKLHELDDKTRSIYQPDVLEFKPYKAEHIKNILNDRIQAGLYVNVISDNILDKIVDMTSAKKDLRFGIEILRKAVMNAENQGKKKVLIEHVPNNIESIEDESYDDILKLIDKGITSGDLFKKMDNMSYSSFRRMLVQMEKKGFITRSVITKGKGKTSMIKVIK